MILFVACLSLKNQLTSLWEIPLYVTFFPFLAFRILSLSLTFAILTMIDLCGIGLFGLIFFGPLGDSLDSSHFFFFKFVFLFAVLIS